MKLFIAIPVYNRKKYLSICARSLYECRNIDKTEIVVFNDGSTEFDETYLKTLFSSPNTKIINAAKKIDIDAHYYQIMQYFLNSDCDVLMICDSDILLRPDAIDYVLDNFNKTDGFLGLYNSDLHRDLFFDGEFVYKEDVGFAGICISREILQKFLKTQTPKANAIDFKMSEFLLKNKMRIMVIRNSLAQHIGFDGAHCNDTSVEFSSNFTPLSDYNKEIINGLIPTALKMQAGMIKHLLFEDKYKRHGFLLHQPHKYLLKRAKNKELKKYYIKRYSAQNIRGK
ncbi:MAG: glycosyltransferase family 2 protein [Elusimicrobiota bacterium]|jgi:glycosyltransferase involved in cell wall biosynthesis|nr:glycosyltransferase family 2 protein [Elusimicrobiota bacterium]